MNNPLLTTKQAAAYLGVSSSFLEKDRWAGAKIPFIRLGTRAIRYDPAILERFVNAQIRKNTVN